MKRHSIDICICTYRRAHLARTLKSLAEMDVPPFADIRVLVADNDTAPTAKSIVEAHQDLPFDVVYIHAPARNISIARNALLDGSAANLVAWIDDDETVERTWLTCLFEALQRDQFTAVFGPAIAVYPPDAPPHLRDGDFHSNRPVRRNGEVRTGHTCNALVDMRDPIVRALRFDLAKGRTGGEDTDYFHRLWREGARMGIADKAEVFEDVVPARLRIGWIIRRSFNSGHIFGELSRGDASLLALPRLVMTALAKTMYCLVVAGLNLGFATRRLWWLRRGAMHMGVLAGLVRLRAKPQY